MAAVRPISAGRYVPVRGDQSSHSGKKHPMKIPVWVKPGVWGAVAGAIAMAIIGFSQLGWTTSATAEQLAQDRSNTSVVAALVPFCVAKAQQDPDKAVFAKAGWATVGNEKSPDNALARACSDKLNGQKSG
jgi:hypothetical protein